MLRILKRLRRWRSSSGFTLVEVIVAGVLLAVLVLGVFSFVTPVLNNVASQEQNARALMLAESINNYIASSLRYAVYVQTVTGVTTGEMHPTHMPATSPLPARNTPYNNDTGLSYLDKYNGGTLNDLYNALYVVTNNTIPQDQYEIGCIGIRWMKDEKLGTNKLFLTKESVFQNEAIDESNLYLDDSKSKLIFETVFYDNLFPIIDIENYDNQYALTDDAGNRNTQIADADLDLANSLRITTRVYTDSDCYSTTKTKRDKAMVTFEGTGYAPLEVVNQPLLNNGDYKLQPNIRMHTYDEALGMSGTSDGTYYPDTYIYFITRKT